MRRAAYWVVALTLFTGSRAHAQEFVNLWTQCTPGSLRSCASTEIGLSQGADLYGTPVTLLLVRISNLQGLFGYESGPRGLRSMQVNGLQSSEPLSYDPGWRTDHYAIDGSVTATGELDSPNTNPGADRDVSVLWGFNRGSYLFGCDLQPYAVGDFPFYDSTCAGSITYAVSLIGSYRMERNPSVSFYWRSWEGDDGVGVSTSCTTGVDCATVTPEPVTWLLMATGLAGVAGVHLRHRRRRDGED